MNQKIADIKSNINILERRKAKNKANYMFELNRGVFYRSLKKNVEINELVTIDNIKEYWDTQW